MQPRDLELLGNSSLLKGIDLEVLWESLKPCQVIEIPEGTILLSPERENDNVYMVLSGKLRVHLGDVSLPPFTHIEAGDCAGEMSIIDGKRVSAHVIAAGKCRLLVMPESVLWTLVNTSHGVARNLLYILAGRMRSDNDALLTSFRKQVEFEQVANVDGLTGLCNRRWMSQAFPRVIRRCAVGGQNLVLIMLDIDHFKTFNDSYGHLAGDTALCHVAEQLTRNLRPTDLIARYGGEEFSVLLPDTDMSVGMIVAERLRNEIFRLQLPPSQDQPLPSVAISLGLAQLRPGDTLESLIACADGALYRAKNKGRNCVSD